MLYKITSVMELLEISHVTVYRMVASGPCDAGSHIETRKPSGWAGFLLSGA